MIGEPIEPVAVLARVSRLDQKVADDKDVHPLELVDFVGNDVERSFVLAHGIRAFKKTEIAAGLTRVPIVTGIVRGATMAHWRPRSYSQLSSRSKRGARPARTSATPRPNAGLRMTQVGETGWAAAFSPAL